MAKKIRLAVGVSGGGTNLQAIMDKCARGQIDAEVVVVFADNNEAHGLTRAKSAGILAFVVDYKRHLENYRQHGFDVLPPDFSCEEYISKGGNPKKECELPPFH